MNPNFSINWLTQDLDDCPGNNDWLSDREKVILDRLRFVKRRSDWRLGRWTAKKTIRTFFKNSPEFEEIEILPDEDGSPRAYMSGDHVPFSISISHSNSIAMCCLFPKGFNLGCDIEYIEERSENFLADYFTNTELNLVRQSENPHKKITANLIWSAKESALKTLKEGLRLDTRSVCVLLEKVERDAKWFPLQIAVNEKYELYGWGRVGENFVQTIACELETTEPLRIDY